MHWRLSGSQTTEEQRMYQYFLVEYKISNL